MGNETYDEEDVQRFREYHMNAGQAYYDRAPSPRHAALELPSVTLLCADCVHIEYAIPAIERCKALCRFGAVKLLTSMPTDYEHRVEIKPLTSLSAYSTFMLKEAWKHVETPHCLVVQHDGWILNANAWDPAWLGRDYIGPLFIHKHQTAAKSVGSGGFSLRSRKLMEHIAAHLPPWDWSDKDTKHHIDLVGSYEDGYIAITLRDPLTRAGFTFGTPGEAARFAQGGNNDPAYHIERPFGFHGLWQNINHETGTVAPPPFRG